MARLYSDNERGALAVLAWLSLLAAPPVSSRCPGDRDSGPGRWKPRTLTTNSTAPTAAVWVSFSAMSAQGANLRQIPRWQLQANSRYQQSSPGDKLSKQTRRRAAVSCYGQLLNSGGFHRGNRVWFMGSEVGLMALWAAITKEKWKFVKLTSSSRFFCIFREIPEQSVFFRQRSVHHAALTGSAPRFRTPFQNKTGSGNGRSSDDSFNNGGVTAFNKN